MALRGARFRAERSTRARLARLDHYLDVCTVKKASSASPRRLFQDGVPQVRASAARGRTDASVAITVFADPEVDYAFPTRGVLAGGSRVNVVGRGIGGADGTRRG